MITKELKDNEYVVFVISGKEHKAGMLEAVWSSKAGAFWVLDDNGEKVYSNDVRTKEPRTTRRTAPMVEIVPDTMTEKAYGIITGTNGCMSRGNTAYYYKWVAKSICEEKDGKVYAPIWAIK